MCQQPPILAAHLRFLPSIGAISVGVHLRTSPQPALSRRARGPIHRTRLSHPAAQRNFFESRPHSRLSRFQPCQSCNRAGWQAPQDRNWTSISIRGQGSTCCLLWAACNQGLSPSEKVPQAILWIRLIGAFPIRRPKSLALQFGRRLGRPVLGGPVHFIPGLRSVRQRQAFWQRT
jgi:hypothetical protein